MLKPKGISQCECDVWKDTCSDCFIRGYIKPWCENCHKYFNDGKCGCSKPKPFIRKGWVDNTKIIVKHTEQEKETIRGWQKSRETMLQQASDFYNKCWQGGTCTECGAEFSVRGGKLDTCKKCTLEILNDKDKYKDGSM